MMRIGENSRRGTSLVEFGLACVPIFFTIIAVFEISRCMWTYETLSYAVTEATRLAIVHGENCAASPNACSLTVAGVAQRIADSSQGLFPDQMTVTLVSTGGGATINCTPLTSCLTNGGTWPVSPGNARGSDIIITAVYPFQSAITSLFPGFLTFNLPASSREQIQF